MTAQEKGEWVKDDEYDPKPSILPDKIPTYSVRSKSDLRWKDYDRISPKSHESLTPHQLFLLTPFIGGFALDDKSWSKSSFRY
jgi:hypothetical protein